MALVDWVLNMPEDIHNTQLSPGDITTPRNVLYAEYTSLLKTVFKVLCVCYDPALVFVILLLFVLMNVTVSIIIITVISGR